MKRTYILYIQALFLFLFLIYSCSEPDKGIPADDGTVPSQITDIDITQIPGGATLTYQLPSDGNILYVMAEYRLGDGILHNKKSSYFSSSITLEGFPDTNPYDINLYSVSRSGVKSEPVTKTIVPLTPPYQSAHDALQLEPTFGGMRVYFENPSRANLKFIVVTADSLGKFYQAYTHYTQIETGNFAIRGFDPTQRVFGVYTLDRWNNHSDTLFAEINPWYEEKLDKTRFVNAKLPSDVYEPHMSSSYSLEVIWNDIWGTSGCFHSKPSTGIPQWFTIDLRAKARLSRMKFYHRTTTGTDGQYNAGDPQIFVIYGSNTLTDEWDDNWILLGHFESIKPSGAAGYTDEDVQYACHEGEDFDFINNDPFRYIRFKTLKTWGGVTYIYIAELTFWGEVLETY
ncbi:MAG: DUF4959 domain-containing protein [Bacteroidales bacterium]|jgi:hypothetical protein|nr:DUF4959 domain-containing protein [Bacteroidales bacterium]